MLLQKVPFLIRHDKGCVLSSMYIVPSSYLSVIPLMCRMIGYRPDANKTYSHVEENVLTLCCMLCAALECVLTFPIITKIFFLVTSKVGLNQKGIFNSAVLTRVRRMS